MTGTLTLTISGGDSGPFDIYQDTDNFATAIATNIAGSTLAAGTSITLDTSAKTVRVVSTGNCLNYKDIDINFGQDTSPSITVATDYTLPFTVPTKSIRLVSDGKDFLWGTWSDDLGLYSLDNGTNWQFSSFNQVSRKFPIYDQSSVWYINDTSTNVYQITPSSLENVTPSHSTDIVLGSGEVFRNYFWYNNYYYIATDLRLLRSSNNTNFDAVISYPGDRGATYISQKQLVGYGNTLYHSSPNGMDLYKSTDNGRNWTRLLSDTNSHRFAYLYIEDANKIMYAGVNGLNEPWVYSTDGGTTWFNSWMQPGQKGGVGQSLSAGIYKYNDIYYYTQYSGGCCQADSLSYTASSPFASTGTKLGSVPSVYFGKQSQTTGTSLALMHVNKGRMHLAGNLVLLANDFDDNVTKAITIDIDNT